MVSWGKAKQRLDRNPSACLMLGNILRTQRFDCYRGGAINLYGPLVIEEMTQVGTDDEERLRLPQALDDASDDKRIALAKQQRHDSDVTAQSDLQEG